MRYRIRTATTAENPVIRTSKAVRLARFIYRLAANSHVAAYQARNALDRLALRMSTEGDAQAEEAVSAVYMRV